jgi:multicomponent Na+:H+ antiporter subunit G
MMLLEGIGIVLVLIGVVFYGIGTAGMWRLPDVYSRLHATGIMSSFGIGFIAIGAGLIAPADLLIKGIALLVLTIITAPVASHTIALSAHHLGVPTKTKTSRIDTSTTPNRFVSDESAS